MFVVHMLVLHDVFLVVQFTLSLVTDVFDTAASDVDCVMVAV